MENLCCNKMSSFTNSSNSKLDSTKFETLLRRAVCRVRADCTAQLPYRHLWRFKYRLHVDQTDDVYGIRCAIWTTAVVVWTRTACERAELTHSAEHTLDLVITRTDTDITDLHVGDMISDRVRVVSCCSLHD